MPLTLLGFSTLQGFFLPQNSTGLVTRRNPHDVSPSLCVPQPSSQRTRAAVRKQPSSSDSKLSSGTRIRQPASWYRSTHPPDSKPSPMGRKPQPANRRGNQSRSEHRGPLPRESGPLSRESERWSRRSPARRPWIRAFRPRSPNRPARERSPGRRPWSRASGPWNRSSRPVDWNLRQQRQRRVVRPWSTYHDRRGGCCSSSPSSEHRIPKEAAFVIRRRQAPLRTRRRWCPPLWNQALARGSEARGRQADRVLLVLWEPGTAPEGADPSSTESNPTPGEPGVGVSSAERLVAWQAGRQAASPESEPSAAEAASGASSDERGSRPWSRSPRPRRRKRVTSELAACSSSCGNPGQSPKGPTHRLRCRRLRRASRVGCLVR